MGIKSISLALSMLVMSTGSNAAVLNNLNSIDYEWLELTETTGLSRDQVELRLADSNDALFGYQYASRALIEDLFLSYATQDGLAGFHVALNVINGVETLMSDFGLVPHNNGFRPKVSASVDGGNFTWYGFGRAYGMYGTSDECGTITETCMAQIDVYRMANAGQATATYQSASRGWGASTSSVARTGTSLGYSTRGSFLVKDLSPVPVPAAAWLFGSGLLGLIGVARRKKV